MTPLTAARIQIGNSLAFHIIFSVLSAGLPLVIVTMLICYTLQLSQNLTYTMHTVIIIWKYI
jgi:cytochrome bd-type quinol oxidase subunit 1